MCLARCSAGWTTWLTKPTHPVPGAPPRSEPGKYATKVGQSAYHTCELCEDGYYRSGDASSTNNVCRPIPSGESLPPAMAHGCCRRCGCCC